MKKKKEQDILRGVVSVILPVYSPGEGISRCITSLREQTLREIEIIFVDDHGERSAIEQIIKAAKEDPRIRLIKNDSNMGAGFSRNHGMEFATGEYLSFMDPDDYVDVEFLQRLYTCAQETGADIVKGERLNVDENGVLLAKSGKGQNTILRKGLEEGKPLFRVFTSRHQSAIYRREMILRSGARYGMSRNSQDTTFLLEACMAAESIEFVDDAHYYYVVRPGSRKRDYSVQRLGYELNALEEKLAYLEKEKREIDAFLCGYLRESILNIMRIQARVMTFNQPGARAFLEELHVKVRGLPFVDRLAVGAGPLFITFLEYGANLMENVRYEEEGDLDCADRLSTVARYVDFLSANSELQGKYHKKMREVFHTALDACNEEEKRWLKRKEKRQLSQNVRRLNPSDILRGESLTIRLFIDYGIDLTEFRQTVMGKVIGQAIGRSKSLLRRGKR